MRNESVLDTVLFADDKRIYYKLIQSLPILTSPDSQLIMTKQTLQNH